MLHMSRQIPLCFQVPFGVTNKRTRHGRNMEERSFVELPPPIRAGYERKLAACRLAWEATGDPLAIAEALTLTTLYCQLNEPWLEEAAIQALVRTRSSARAKQHRIDMKHFRRWRFLRDLKGHYVEDPAGHMRWKWNPPGKPSWEKARELVAKELAKCGDNVEPDNVQASYEIVQDDMRAGCGDKYFFLKDKRYRHLG